MDFNIVPQLVIVFSIAGILVIIGRNFSKMKEAAREEVFQQESEREKAEKEKFRYLYERAIRRINKENYQRKMADFWLWLEKLLRKIRIVVLKLDGKMVGVLEHLRKKNSQSLEDWKRLAEKNMLKSKEAEMLTGFFGAATHRKHRKDKEERPQSASDDNVIEKQGAAPSVTVVDHYTVENQETEDMPCNTYVEEEMPKEEEGEAKIGTICTQEGAGEEDAFESAEEGTPEAEKTMEESSMTEDTATGISAIITGEPAEEGENEGLENDTIRTKKEEECIEILMKNPADIKAYWRLGLIYSKRRNYEDALACFRQIVKIDPTYTKAKQKAIELMEKMKKRGK